MDYIENNNLSVKEACIVNNINDSNTESLNLHFSINYSNSNIYNNQKKNILHNYIPYCIKGSIIMTDFGCVKDIIKDFNLNKSLSIFNLYVLIRTNINNKVYDNLDNFYNFKDYNLINYKKNI